MWYASFDSWGEYRRPELPWRLGAAIALGEMSDQEDVLGVIDALYAAALEPDTWPQALHLLGQSVGAVGTILVSMSHPVPTLASPELVDLGRDYIENGWWERDSRTAVGRKMGMPANLVVTDTDLLSEEKISRDAYYQDFLRKNGLERFLSMVTRLPQDQLVSIAPQRDARKGAFTRSEIQRFSLLAPHAARAFVTCSKLMEARRFGAEMAQVINRLACGIIFLDAAGGVTFVSDPARAFIGDGLRIAHKQIHTDNRADDQMLAKLTASLLPGSGQPPQGVVIIQRPSGRRPLIIEGVPVRPSDSSPLENLALGPGGAMLLIHDPDEQPDAESVSRHLRRLGLTAAEARVAERIGQGLGPKEVSDKLAISEGTVRAQLRSIFAKLSISRQSELAILVTRLTLLARHGKR